MGQQQYFLETIVEETSDDLCSESDKSGPTGWNSDSDADSVIHMPSNPGMSKRSNLSHIENIQSLALFSLLLLINTFP